MFASPHPLLTPRDPTCRRAGRPPWLSRLARTAFVAALTACAVATPGGLVAQKAERPDEKAAAAARALAERRSSAEEIAAAMRSRYRQSSAQTSAILRSLRMGAATSGDALSAAYRLSGDPLASALLAGGFSASQVVVERRSLRLRSEELARTLAKRGASAREIADAFQKSGGSVEETATVLRVVGVPMSEAAKDLDQRYGTLEPLRMRRALTSAGYTAQAPAVHRYSIVGLEKAGSSDPLVDVGIVDPARVEGSGSPDDGVVTIEGQGFEDPGLSASIEHPGGTAEGVILSVQDNELRVQFSDFGSGSLVVTTTGGTVRRPVAALSHATLSTAQLFAPKPTLAFVGARGLLTWPLASTGEASADFSPPPDVNVTVHGSDENPTLSLPPSSGSDLTLQAVFNVQANVAGTMIPSVECWTCEDYKIRLDECSTLTVACISSILADAAGSLVRCANPANWTRRVVPYGSVPVAGTGLATLTYRARVGVHPGGSLSVHPGAPDYQGALFATVPLPSYASRTTLTSWWNATVVPRLLDLNGTFAEAVSRRLDADPVTLVPGIGPGADLIGVYAQSPDQVRLVFRH